MMPEHQKLNDFMDYLTENYIIDTGATFPISKCGLKRVVVLKGPQMLVKVFIPSTIRYFTTNTTQIQV